MTREETPWLCRSLTMPAYAERALRERTRRLYGDAAVADLEKGAPHNRTKASIDKLMSDAEKQYIAEYSKKQDPEESGLTYRGPPSKSPSVISVQRLSDSQPMSQSNRTWSLKRVFSFSRNDIAPRPDPPRTPEPQ